VTFAARLGVLLLVAAAGLGALVAGRRADGTSRRYACPMHPQVAAPVPGPCVICGMALEPVRPGATGESPIQAERFLSYGLAPVHRRAPTTKVQSPAWLDAGGGVTALLFEDELNALARDERGTFFTARNPTAPLAVERTAEAPVRWRGSTWRVRFRVRSGGAAPLARAATSGWLERDPAGREPLVVLSSAVLQTPTGPRLLAPAADHRGTRSLPVVTGRVMYGYTAVISGARERELVLGQNVFSLDAEAQLQSQRRAAAAELEP
jgi:hypothetical protein